MSQQGLSSKPTTNKWMDKMGIDPSMPKHYQSEIFVARVFEQIDARQGYKAPGKSYPQQIYDRVYAATGYRPPPLEPIVPSQPIEPNLSNTLVPGKSVMVASETVPNLQGFSLGSNPPNPLKMHPVQHPGDKSNNGLKAQTPSLHQLLQNEPPKDSGPNRASQEVTNLLATLKIDTKPIALAAQEALVSTQQPTPKRTVYIVEGNIDKVPHIVGIFSSSNGAEFFAPRYAAEQWRIDRTLITDVVPSRRGAATLSDSATRRSWNNGTTEINYGKDFVKLYPHKCDAGNDTVVLAIDRTKGGMVIIGVYNDHDTAWEGCGKYWVEQLELGGIWADEEWFEDTGVRYCEGRISGVLHCFSTKAYKLDEAEGQYKFDREGRLTPPIFDDAEDEQPEAEDSSWSLGSKSSVHDLIGLF